MLHLELKGIENRRLVFYLALEEYLAENVSEDILVLWQVKPTVIFGRNQVIENEVNLSYCKDHGIEFYRRKSGGGCVYSDMGNLMLSYITPDRNADRVFQGYLDMVAGFLRSMGFDAVKSEHNDVMISSRKVSGNAFHVTSKASVVHGTLLYDLDFKEMEQAIKPPLEKLNRRGIESVRQRVVNLKELGLELSLEELKSALVRHTCNKTDSLSPDEIQKVEAIEQEYLNPGFIFGR